MAAATPEQGNIHPKSITRNLASIAALLVLLNLVAVLVRLATGDRYLRLVRLFMLDAENNIPTYFSSLMLLAAGLILAAIAAAKRREMNEYTRHWRALSILFVLISFDETVSLHEMLNHPIRQLLGLHGIFFFGFLVIAIPMMVVLAALYAKFLVHLPSQTKFHFVLAAVLYLGGEIGVEMLGGLYIQRSGPFSIGYFLITTLEETLELAGIILFLHGLLTYAAQNLPEIRLKISEID